MAKGFVKGALKLRGANPTDNDMKFGSNMVNKFKNQYPDAWKMVKQGNLKGALNNIGIKTEAKEEDIVKLFTKYGLIEMPIPKSTMYGLVIDGKYVAKGSKEKMRRMQKKKAVQFTMLLVKK